MRNVRGQIDPSSAAKTAYKSAGRDMIRFIMLLPLKIIGLLFMAIGAILDGVNRRRIEQEKQAEKQRREQYKTEQAAQREQERRERAARIATDRARRIAIQERREQERREKERIKADRDSIKWEWAQRREQEREKAAAWKECCYKSKLGLEYQNATDNETYARVRGTELYALLDQYEQELIDAVDAGNAKQIERARKNLINTRRLLRENEKTVYMDKFKKEQFKAYCSGE